jgi:hypothetical protein
MSVGTWDLKITLRRLAAFGDIDFGAHRSFRGSTNKPDVAATGVRARHARAACYFPRITHFNWIKTIYFTVEIVKVPESQALSIWHKSPPLLARTASASFRRLN